MKIRPAMLLLTAAALTVLLFSCTSAGDPSAGGSAVVEETMLSRPFVNKPVRRPLGRVQISWEQVDNAVSYRVEKSENRRFSKVENTWTVSGTSLEIAVAADEVFWIRVQAMNPDTTSRWSPELEIRESRL